MMVRYRAQYVLGDKKETPFRNAYADSLFDLKDGFWVNNQFHFTKGADAAFWIPPSALLVILKEETP